MTYIHESFSAAPPEAVDCSAGGSLRKLHAARTRQILVMDDSELICTIIKKVLSVLGYRVLLSKNGGEAVALYKQAKEREDPVDAVIIDLHVPSGMNGKETIKKLIEIDPEVKAVVTSGDILAPEIMNFKEFGFVGALVKPFLPEDLKKILARLAPLKP